MNFEIHLSGKFQNIEQKLKYIDLYLTSLKNLSKLLEYILIRNFLNKNSIN